MGGMSSDDGRASADPWADREGALPRYAKEPAAVEFFIPHLTDDHAQAEAEWARYLALSGARPDSRRGYSMTYIHNGGQEKFEVKVGEERRQFRLRTGRATAESLTLTSRRSGTGLAP